MFTISLDAFGEKKFLMLFLFFVALTLLSIVVVDYSEIESTVKVLEVGKRYAILNFGEQYYIRVQNAFSEQYASSSESWETCIDQKDYEIFKQTKDSKATINIKVSGYGITTKFACLTGDRVIKSE